MLIQDNPVYDYFYARCIGGDALGEYIDGGKFNGPTDLAENRYGQHRKGPGPGACCSLYAGGSDNLFSLFGNVPFHPGLPLGAAMKTSNTIYSAVGLTSAVWTDVTLQSVVPIPLPAAAYLFTSGLVGLLLDTRRRERERAASGRVSPA